MTILKDQMSYGSALTCTAKDGNGTLQAQHITDEWCGSGTGGF